MVFISSVFKMPEHTPAPTPSRAVYGFVMFLSFNIFFILYLVWAIVPEEYFERIGIDFLPQRYWAVSVPIYILTGRLSNYILFTRIAQETLFQFSPYLPS